MSIVVHNSRCSVEIIENLFKLNMNNTYCDKTIRTYGRNRSPMAVSREVNKMSEDAREFYAMKLELQSVR